jgi:hypothetical protein
MSLIDVSPEGLTKNFINVIVHGDICLKFEDFWLEMKVSMKKLFEMKNEFSLIFSIQL